MNIKKSLFSFLARIAFDSKGDEAKLNAVIDVIKQRLKAKGEEINRKGQEDFQSRFGPGGGQDTFAGTYTGD
jgi:hypothetical protein